MYVHLSANLLTDPLTILALTVFVISFIYLIFAFFRHKARILLYCALAALALIVSLSLAIYAAYNCGLSISEDKITLKHLGCASIFVGIPCEYSFSINDVEKVIVTTWDKSPCKVEVRTFGLGTLIMSSGYFKTTCGTALVHSVGKHVVIFKLKNGEYVIIGASKETVNQIVNELIRLGLKPVIEFENETSHTTSR